MTGKEELPFVLTFFLLLNNKKEISGKRRMHNFAFRLSSQVHSNVFLVKYICVKSWQIE